jgi:hypothetical protein
MHQKYVLPIEQYRPKAEEEEEEEAGWIYLRKMELYRLLSVDLM